MDRIRDWRENRHFPFHVSLPVLNPWDTVQNIGRRKLRLLREQSSLLHTWKPVVQKMPPKGHFLAMQASLLAEGSLSLGMPLVGLCDFCL